MTFKYQRYPIYRPFLQGAFYLYYTLDTIALQTSDGFLGTITIECNGYRQAFVLMFFVPVNLLY